MTGKAAAGTESPCVRECVIDQVSGYCVGCLRTLDEISFWTRYTQEERRRLCAQLAARRAARQPAVR